MKNNQKLAPLGLGLWLIAMGIKHIGAPHWLVMALNAAAIVALVMFLGRQSGLRQRKLAWLRGLLGRKEQP